MKCEIDGCENIASFIDSNDNFMCEECVEMEVIESMGDITFNDYEEYK